MKTDTPAIPAAPIRHWQQAHYTTVRNGTGQYTFLGTERAALEQHREGIITDLERLNRRLTALENYLSGESISCPSALNF